MILNECKKRIKEAKDLADVMSMILSNALLTMFATQPTTDKVKMLIGKRAHESTNKTGTFTIEFYDLGFGLLYNGDNIPLNLI